MVTALDSQSDGPRFESRSGHLVDFFSVVPSLSPQPTGCLLPVGVFNPVMFCLSYLFQKYLDGVPVN